MLGHAELHDLTSDENFPFQRGREGFDTDAFRGMMESFWGGNGIDWDGLKGFVECTTANNMLMLIEFLCEEFTKGRRYDEAVTIAEARMLRLNSHAMFLVGFLAAKRVRVEVEMPS